MNPLKKILVILIISFACTTLCSCYDAEPIENLSIVTGIGVDMSAESPGKLMNSIEVLTVKGKDIEGSALAVGEGYTIYSTSEHRKTKQSRKFVLGSELIFLISEERAKFGIEDILDTIVRITKINTNAMIAVCKGNSDEYYSLEPDMGIMSEQLFGLIKFSHDGNFYSNKSTINDLLHMYYQHGREIYLPYIEIQNKKPILAGTAIFRNSKMIQKFTLEESRLINLLRNSGGKGVISILSDNPQKYIDLHGKNKVKVTVSKEDDHLKYDIFVNISGVLRCATLLDKDITKEEVKKIERLFAERLNGDLNNEVKKIQDEYRVDCLDLGKYALAKYGRKSGYDRDENFLNAKINVHTKVKVSSIGRAYKSSKKDK